jgi:hypothetical protein
MFRELKGGTIFMRDPGVTLVADGADAVAEMVNDRPKESTGISRGGRRSKCDDGS